MTATPNIRAWLAKAFHTEILQSTRWPWVDYLKGIAILLVVYRHTLMGIQNNGVYTPNYLVTANMIFYSFRMPLFFMLSGLFLARSLAKAPWTTVLRKKFDTLLYPYPIWSFLQLSILIVLARFGLSHSEHTAHDYRYIITQPRNVYQFWYLIALFNCSMVYILTKAKLKLPIWAQLILGVVLFFASSIPAVNHISMLSDWMSYYIFYALGDAFAGWFFRPSTARALGNPWVLAASAPFFLAAQLWYMHLGYPLEGWQYLLVALVGSATMISLAFCMEKWNVLRFLRVVGYHSLYIYIVHMLIESFTRMVLTHLCHVHEVHVLLLAGITSGVVVSIIFYNLLVDGGPLWFLFTPPRISQLMRPFHGMDSHRQMPRHRSRPRTPQS